MERTYGAQTSQIRGERPEDSWQYQEQQRKAKEAADEVKTLSKIVNKTFDIAYTSTKLMENCLEREITNNVAAVILASVKNTVDTDSGKKLIVLTDTSVDVAVQEQKVYENIKLQSPLEDKINYVNAVIEFLEVVGSQEILGQMTNMKEFKKEVENYQRTLYLKKYSNLDKRTIIELVRLGALK